MLHSVVENYCKINGCGEKFMNYKTLLALPAIVLLAACGGDGDGA
jgi:hypothetical protein